MITRRSLNRYLATPAIIRTPGLLMPVRVARPAEPDTSWINDQVQLALREMLGMSPEPGPKEYTMTLNYEMPLASKLTPSFTEPEFTVSYGRVAAELAVNGAFTVVSMGCKPSRLLASLEITAKDIREKFAAVVSPEETAAATSFFDYMKDYSHRIKS